MPHALSPDPVLRRRCESEQPHAPTLDYGDPGAEYKAAAGGCALIARPTQRIIRMTGSDAPDLLHRICTANIRALRDGQGLDAAILTPIGRLVAVFWVGRDGGALDLELDAELADRTLAEMERAIIMEDAGAARRDDVVVLSLQGPRSGNTLGACADGPLPATADHFTRLTIADMPVRAVARRHSPAGGFDLHVPPAGVEAVTAALRAAGAVPAGYAALDAVRIEAGLPWWGRELDHDTIPVDAGLGALIDYRKGCFPGQEVLARLMTRGYPARKLWGLLVAGAPPPRGATVLDTQGEACGEVTSSAWSPRLSSAVALAICRWGRVEAGATIRLEHQEQAWTAEVRQLPLLHETPTSS